MKILALDISSTHVGYSIFEDKIIQRYGFVDISKIESEKLLDKVLMFEKVFEFPENIDEVVIEESLKSFSYGKTSINTIILLAKINSAFSLLLYKKYNRYPKYLNASSVRKLIGLKIDKNSTVDKKQQILDFVDKKLNLFLLVKNEKIDSRNFDVADSIVLNLAYK
jgi:hypothetical protein